MDSSCNIYLFPCACLLLRWNCNTVEPLFYSQFLYNNSCEYAWAAHMTAQNNGECFPNIYDTCFLTSKWLWLQYWDDRKVEVLQCPSSTVISIKVHLHWAKANVKAIFFFDLCRCTIWTLNWIFYKLIWKRCCFLPNINEPLGTILIFSIYFGAVDTWLHEKQATT